MTVLNSKKVKTFQLLQSMYCFTLQKNPEIMKSTNKFFVVFFFLSKQLKYKTTES